MALLYHRGLFLSLIYLLLRRKVGGSPGVLANASVVEFSGAAPEGEPLSLAWRSDCSSYRLPGRVVALPPGVARWWLSTDTGCRELGSGSQELGAGNQELGTGSPGLGPARNWVSPCVYRRLLA